MLIGYFLYHNYPIKYCVLLRISLILSSICCGLVLSVKVVCLLQCMLSSILSTNPVSWKMEVSMAKKLSTVSWLLFFSQRDRIFYYLGSKFIKTTVKLPSYLCSRPSIHLQALEGKFPDEELSFIKTDTKTYMKAFFTPSTFLHSGWRP